MLLSVPDPIPEALLSEFPREGKARSRNMALFLSFD
jgi:hypothetical protein